MPFETPIQYPGCETRPEFIERSGDRFLIYGQKAVWSGNEEQLHLVADYCDSRSLVLAAHSSSSRSAIVVTGPRGDDVGPGCNGLQLEELTW